MNIYYSELFGDKVKKLPIEVKRALKKKLELLLENPRHPSLRTKKIQGQDGIFETSITMNIRMTWQYTEDGILLRNIGEHDQTLNNP
ncbi:cytotoxin [Clostridiales bacterium PH28_bin88]|nr:cytotoxin [Clostridiales bacterium PH28_bin88]